MIKSAGDGAIGGVENCAIEASREWTGDDMINGALAGDSTTDGAKDGMINGALDCAID